MQGTLSSDPQTEADVAFVVREFSNYVRRNEIKQAMMVRRGLSWNEAEAFVAYVEQHHGGKVAARQLPLLLVLNTGILVFGTVLMSYACWRWSTDPSIGRYAMRRIVSSFCTGFMMIGGSLVGFWQSWRDLHR